ncbi:MAG TPA: DUF2497 domain-containing protein [Acetobacteraceae bacterium]|nr:DUF2497 domain-containing protein [Acetobacteraceae bacterium]
MSNAQTPPPAGASGNDPSMEDILASIRRILSEEEPSPTPAPAAAEQSAPVPQNTDPEEKSDDVLVLDPSMLVTEEEELAPEAEEPPPEPPAEPPPEPPAEPAEQQPAIVATEVMPPGALLAPEAEEAASHSVGTLMRTLVTERALQVHRGGPTIEDMVREELRPLLKQWLDANLPDLVERLVRAEIERVVHRALP